MNKLVVVLILVAVAACAIGGVVWWASHTQHRADVAETRADDAEDQAAGAQTQADLNADTTQRTSDLALRDRTIIEEVHREQERVRLALTPDGGVEGAVSAWADGIDRLRDAGPAPGRVANRDGPGDGELALQLERTPFDAGGGNAGRSTIAARSRRDLRRAHGRVSRSLGRLPRARPLDRHTLAVLDRASGRSAAMRRSSSRRRGDAR